MSDISAVLKKLDENSRKQDEILQRLAYIEKEMGISTERTRQTMVSIALIKVS